MLMLELTFTRERETKNTVRYSEVLDDGQDRGYVGSLYLLKAKDDELGQPGGLAVTITPSTGEPG
jgi:hypothetical protein